MKVVAVALFLANLLLFGWLYSHPQTYRADPVMQAQSFPPSIEPLMLLRERTKAVSQPPADTPSTSETQEETAAGTANLVSGPADAHDNSAPMPTAITSVTQARDKPSLEATAGAVSESGTESSSPTEATSSSTVEEKSCQTIGPFSSRPQVEELVSQLVELERAPAIRASQIEQPSGYWVYLPSMPHAEAQRIIDDLSAKGVKDYFLGRQDFISLGVFSDKRSAEVRVRDITALGYTPRLEPRFMTREVFWVDLEENSSQRIDDSQWSAMIKNQAEVRRQSVVCE